MEKSNNRYHIYLKYSKNGVSWSSTTTYVSASSEAEAKRIVKSKFPNPKGLKIIGKWENATRQTNNIKESVTPKAAESYDVERKTSDERYPMKGERAAYFAVIDTETNWSDEIMSIGVVIADSDTFQAVDHKYYIIPTACKKGGMYYDALFLRTPVTPSSLGKRDAMKDLRGWLAKYDVSDIFAYNANFDKTHLPELKKMVWHDIMRLAAYRQYNPRIPANAECCSTGRLKRGYGVEPIMRMLSANGNYCETHNAILDALDELKIMQLLGHDPEKYGTV